MLGGEAESMTMPMMMTMMYLDEWKVLDRKNDDAGDGSGWMTGPETVRS